MNKALSTLAVVAILFSAFACLGWTFVGSLYNDGFVPQPVLTEPKGDVVDLTGKDTLRFGWSPHEQARGMRSFYDFRLYKGYNMVESTRIYKEKVDPRSFYKVLPASMFEDGSVYTWSLRQVYDGGRKSDRSYAYFKVIKR